MDDESANKVQDAVDRMLPEAHQYSYFQLLELMYQVHGDDLEQRPLSHETRRRLRLEVSPKLSFPVADVLSAERIGPSSIQELTRQVPGSASGRAIVERERSTAAG